MMVRELIKMLQNVDPDTLVLTRGYESGYDAAVDVKSCVVQKINSAWYEGDYEDYDKDCSSEKIEATLISSTEPYLL